MIYAPSALTFVNTYAVLLDARNHCYAALVTLPARRRLAGEIIRLRAARKEARATAALSAKLLKETNDRAKKSADLLKGEIDLLKVGHDEIREVCAEFGQPSGVTTTRIRRIGEERDVLKARIKELEAIIAAHHAPQGAGETVNDSSAVQTG